MTVAQLIAILSQLDQDAQVWVYQNGVNMKVIYRVKSKYPMAV